MTDAATKLTDQQKALIRAKVEARRQADEWTDALISVARSLGQAESALVFLAQVRDNLAVLLPDEDTNYKAGDWAPGVSRDSTVNPGCPPGYEQAEVEGECRVLTDKACGIDVGGEMLWIPLSQMAGHPEVGDQIEYWPIRRWFCDKEGIGY